MKIQALSFLLAVLIAGCSGGSDSPTPQTGTTSATSTMSSTLQGNETKPIAPPVELHNDTYPFPGPTDAAISDSFTVPDGVKWINIEMHAWGDCPYYSGAQQPAITIRAPSGGETVLDSFGDNRGFTFSGPCSSPGVGQEYLGVALAEAAAEVGSWTIESQGTFTGDIQIVAIGRYA